MNNQSAVNQLDEIMEGIHNILDSGETEEVKELRLKAHEIIRASNISYTALWQIMKTRTRSTKEFNNVFNRIRKTVLEKQS